MFKQVKLHASFLTRKKSYNPTFIAWVCILCVISVFTILFTLIQITKIKSLNYSFYNVKIGSPDVRGKFIGIEKKPPVFIFQNKKIIFGTMEDIYLPEPDNDVLILDSNNFVSDFNEKIKTYKNASKIFPVENFGVTFQNSNNSDETLTQISQAYNLLYESNQFYSGKTSSNSKKLALFFFNIGHQEN